MQQSGKYFRWLAPTGWTATESPNGVDLKSPDGSIFVNAEMLVGNHGQTDPWGFVSSLLTRVGMRDIRPLSTHDVPAAPSAIPGLNWRIQEFELTFTDTAGSPRRADLTCAISSGYGGYSALFQGFSTPPADFAAARTWLPLMAGGVNAIDANRVAYHSDVIPPTNHPVDPSAIMGAWEARLRSRDHIDQKQHETTMGYERMVSPIDGRTYNMPFELYDGTKGGYRDPADRTRILNHAAPGQ